jgi:ACR3 family arsenite transporter
MTASLADGPGFSSPQCFRSRGRTRIIVASNFFELAVAAAIALFDFQSGAALETVVGVLVEIPVMLSVVRVVIRTRDWYQNT